MELNRIGNRPDDIIAVWLEKGDQKFLIVFDEKSYLPARQMAHKWKEDSTIDFDWSDEVNVCCEIEESLGIGDHTGENDESD